MTVIEAFRAQDAGRIGTSGQHLIRCSNEIGNTAGVLPEWIHCIPAGPIVKTSDNRMFQVSSLQKIAAASVPPVLLDWEHRSEWGGETRAAGWLEEFAAQDGQGKFPRPGLWARAAFTEAGARDVAGKSYRYVSPVLILDGETREVISVVSVALTNRPALTMHELSTFREQFSARPARPARKESSTMSNTSEISTSVRAALKANGLTDEQINAAVTFNAQQCAEIGAPATVAEIDRELASRGLTPEAIAAARQYLSDRRAEVQR